MNLGLRGEGWGNRLGVCPAPHLLTHSLQLLNLLLQDCTVIEKVTVVLLVLAETLTGVTELNRKGIFLFQQLRELK